MIDHENHKTRRIESSKAPDRVLGSALFGGRSRAGRAKEKRYDFALPTGISFRKTRADDSVTSERQPRNPRNPNNEAVKKRLRRRQERRKRMWETRHGGN
jgi:hypothetical protein